MDEASRRKLRIVRIAIAAPAFVFLAVALRGIVVDYRDVRLAKRLEHARTAVTEGTFVEVHHLVSLKSGSRTPEGTVVFTPPTGEPIKFNYVGNDAKLGRKIEVRYDPANPHNFSAGAPLFGLSDLVWDNAFFVVMGAIFLFALTRASALVPEAGENAAQA